MTDHSELENSVAAFVLGAADANESEDVRVHLAGCDECRLLAARLQRATDSLSLAIEIVEPPVRLKSRILDAAVASARTPTQSPAGARIIRLPRERARRWAFGSRMAAGFPKAAVAALALAVLGLGSWNVYLTTQLSREQGQVASGTLTGRGEMTSVQATVLDFKAHSLAVVSFSKLPAVPAGKVYELWLIPASGAADGVAVFQPDIDGSKTVVVSRDLSRYKLIAVTVENGPSGVPAPTQQPNITGPAV